MPDRCSDRAVAKDVDKPDDMSLPYSSEILLADDARALDTILRNALIASSYQPIVDLESGETVGYEALARGPKGSPLEFPDRLFKTARETDRLAELDWECRAAALRGALDNGLIAPMLLFVNVEPEAAFARPPDHLAPLLDTAGEKLRIVCEFTERGLIDRPTDVLAAARVWRKAGVSIALDDVNADPRALAMLPLLRPEIIKLDLSIVQCESDEEIIETLQTVSSWAEKTGTILLAEGVETDTHLRRAKTLGADYAQGWKYGKPIPPTDFVPVISANGAYLTIPEPRAIDTFKTTYEYVSAHRKSRIASKRMMLAISHQLEDVGQVMGPTGVLISSFQRSRFFDQRSRHNYRKMAGTLALVGVIGADMPARPEPGVYGASIGQDDPLLGQWVVCSISPHYCAALVAKDLGDTGPDLDRRFSFCLTHDHELVTGIAEKLIERIIPMRDRTAPAKLRLAS